MCKPQRSASRGQANGERGTLSRALATHPVARVLPLLKLSPKRSTKMAGWLSGLSLESIGAQVSELTQTLGDSASKMGEDLQQKVQTLASFELEDLGKVIQEAEEDIVSEEAKIKQDEAGMKLTEVKILPWETRVEQKTILCHDLMEKVLSLSLEESNFTTEPPTPGAGRALDCPEDGVQGHMSSNTERGGSDTCSAAQFELDRHIKVAIKMLALDPNLAKVHARLISRMPEEAFWHRYFSRVAALRAEVGLEPLCEDFSKEGLGTSTSEEYDKVSHGDTQSLNSPSARIREGASKRDDADEDDDFSDLGDLDDLDGDSEASIDAALEAEIAAELGES